MSRTVRKLPYRQTRGMKGRRAAIRRGDRSIPPNAWDDYQFSDEARMAWRVAEKLAGEGRDVHYIQAVLHDKWKLGNHRARNVARRVMERRMIGQGV